MTAAQCRPPLKWVGGKRSIASALLAHLPDRFERYIEPFAGGAALFFALSPPRARLSDINGDLINVYRTLAESLPALCAALEEHEARHCEAYYYAARARFNARHAAGLSAVEQAALFIYFNKTGFNGLWRVNQQGVFNVPFGRHVRPAIADRATLAAAAVALQRAELRQGDYREMLTDVGPGDVVYLDPPYAKTCATSFTAYTPGGFSAMCQRELAEATRECAARGAHVIVSNHDTDAVRALYPDFHVDALGVARRINRDATRRGPVAELIITNRPPAQLSLAARGVGAW